MAKCTITREITYAETSQLEIEIPDSVLEEHRVKIERIKEGDQSANGDPWPIQEYVIQLKKDGGLKMPDSDGGDWVSTDWYVNKVGEDDAIEEWSY